MPSQHLRKYPLLCPRKTWFTALYQPVPFKIVIWLFMGIFPLQNDRSNGQTIPQSFILAPPASTTKHSVWKMINPNECLWNELIFRPDWVNLTFMRIKGKISVRVMVMILYYLVASSENNIFKMLLATLQSYLLLGIHMIISYIFFS